MNFMNGLQRNIENGLDMSLKNMLEKIERHFDIKDKRSSMKRRKYYKKARNKWIRRSIIPNACKFYWGWEY